MYQNSESKRTFWKDVYLECYIKVEEYLSSEDIWGKRYERQQNSESKRTFWKDVYLECYIKVEEYLSSEDIWGKRYEVVAKKMLHFLVLT